MWYMPLLEAGVLPDAELRWGGRRLDRRRLAEEGRGGPEDRARRVGDWARACSEGPVAVHADAANAQHDEVVGDFFVEVLGPRLKYACCLFPEGVGRLADAEERMLALTSERARLADGQRVLELGCG